MALKYFQAVILIIMNSVLSQEINGTSSIPTVAKAILDPKRRHDLVDEAFSEQKDILLDMLEAKLKEVRDKKKNKTDPVELGNATAEPVKCDVLPNDVDLNIKSNGIIAVGETDVHLKFGQFGNNILKLNATGISNVGKAYVNINIGDRYPNIPGINDLLSGPIVAKNPCVSQPQKKTDYSLHTKINDNLLRTGLELSNASIAKTFASVPNNTSSNEANSKNKEAYITMNSTSSKPTNVSQSTSKDMSTKI